MNNEATGAMTDFVHANTDNSKGFEVAADNVTDLECLDLFRRLAEERTGQAIQLQEVLAVEREFPKPTGTTVAGSHRWWIVLQGTIRNRDEASVLSEVAKKENHLRLMYEETLAVVQGTTASSVVSKQLASISDSCRTIEALKRKCELRKTSELLCMRILWSTVDHCRR